jgi:hypothetical protein
MHLEGENSIRNLSNAVFVSVHSTEKEAHAVESNIPGVTSSKFSKFVLIWVLVCF